MLAASFQNYKPSEGVIKLLLYLITINIPNLLCYIETNAVLFFR